MPRRSAPSVKVLLAALRSTLTAQTDTARWLLGFAKQSHALLANPLFSQPARSLGEYHKKTCTLSIENILTVLAGPGDFALRISRREYCQEQRSRSRTDDPIRRIDHPNTLMKVVMPSLQPDYPFSANLCSWFRPYVRLPKQSVRVCGQSSPGCAVRR